MCFATPQANATVLDWLLDGDISIRYQASRDLLDQEKPALQARIAREGWGARLLACRRQDGHWGRGFYQPKWTSTHYTLIDLKHLCFPRRNRLIRQTVKLVLGAERARDGGIYPFGAERISDMCINGMCLNYACYFGSAGTQLESIVDCILDGHMADGGFNCRLNRSGATHGSMHTTLSVIEGIREYAARRYRYRLGELLVCEQTAQEFLLRHHLFQSHRTGATIDPKMLMLSWPSRWHYDILRCLEYFRSADVPRDPRMDEALTIISSKRRKDGRWPLQAKHPGLTHFEMEKPGQASRWNTLRALRTLRHFEWP